MKTTGLWMEGDALIERHTSDSQAYLDNAQNLRSIGAVGSSELRHAASFDPAVVELYKQKAGIDHHEFMANPVHIRRMLNDPELQGFRIWEGRVKRA